MWLARLRAFLFTDPAIILATILFGTVSLVTSFFDRDGRLQLRVARVWSRTLLAVSGVRVTVKGLEKVDAASSYVFASNHVSYMDTPVVLANIPAQFRFMAKQGLFQIPFLGSHLKRAGHIAVPRADPRAAVKTLSEAARIIRERGISVLVFPEGGRSWGTLDSFKEGGAHIAIKAGVPIVPVSIKGTGAVLPRGSGIVCPGEVVLEIGDPIETTTLTPHDRGRLMARVREQVVAQLEILEPSER